MQTSHLSKFLLPLGLSLAVALTGCGTPRLSDTAIPVEDAADSPDSISTPDNKDSSLNLIELSGSSAALNSEPISEYDYTWHCDPGTCHDEVKDAPAEYYTGTSPDTDAAVYIDHELYYFPQLEESGFRKVNYDGEQEWAYYYTDGVNNNYIFATLPALGNSIPTQMMHSEEEAAANKVLHITKPGTYVLTGTWNGQINIDLGDSDTVFSDEASKVTLILQNADITCTVAPGIIFKNVYECDNTWEERSVQTPVTDISDAGAMIVLADNSSNHISGTNVYRMLKTVYKNDTSTEEIKTQKKLRKTDGALYSYMSMLIKGESENDGTLTVDAGYEGIDSELHLSIDGGVVTVNSGDDGMNVNEDHVSTAIINGGIIEIHAAQDIEGDGIDSNGYIVVNDGTISITGIRGADNGLDSEDGIYYNGGTIVINEEEQSCETGSVYQEIGGRAFGGPDGNGTPPDGGFGGPDGNGTPPEGGFSDSSGDRRGNPFSAPENFDIRAFKAAVAELDDDATFEDVLNLIR